MFAVPPGYSGPRVVLGERVTVLERLCADVALFLERNSLLSAALTTLTTAGFLGRIRGNVFIVLRRYETDVNVWSAIVRNVAVR